MNNKQGKYQDFVMNNWKVDVVSFLFQWMLFLSYITNLSEFPWILVVRKRNQSTAKRTLLLQHCTKPNLSPRPGGPNTYRKDSEDPQPENGWTSPSGEEQPLLSQIQLYPRQVQRGISPDEPIPALHTIFSQSDSLLSSRVQHASHLLPSTGGVHWAASTSLCSTSIRHLTYLLWISHLRRHGLQLTALFLPPGWLCEIICLEKTCSFFSHTILPCQLTP